MTFNEILSQLDGVTGGGNQWYAKCPAHVDNKPSLSISTGKDGRVLLNCHAGCTTEEIVDAMGLTMNDLFQRSTATDDFKGAGRSPVVARYDYQDADGTFLAQKLRRADKSFAWRRPDGHGGWIYNRQGLTIPPYNLPDVLAADHIYIVEGEKDADTLSSHGKIAVCGADGAGPGKWRSHYTGWLKGKSVTILQDNDDVGKAFAAETAAAVSKVAKSVKLLDLTREWPELPKHGDVSDILQSGDPKLTLARLESLEAITPEWSPAPPDSTEQEENRVCLETFSARELQDADLPPVIFIVKNLLTAGLSLLVSPPKYGKSWMVLDLCLAIAAGLPFLGYETEKGECLYLALEDSKQRLQDRMNKVLKGERAPMGFDYATTANDLDNGLLDQLEGYTAKNPKVKLIVIDTLQKVRGSVNGRENAYSADYRAMGMFKTFADKHGICILLVHHLRKMKDEGDPFNMISGTSAILGAADTAMVLTRDKRSDDNTKFSVIGRDVDSTDTILRFDKSEFRWKSLGDANWLEEQRARLEYRDNPIVITIKKLLEQNPGGWSGSMTELLDAGKYIARTYLAENTRALTNKVKALDKPLFDYDGIVHTRAKNGSKNGGGGGRHKFYYSTVGSVDGNEAIIEGEQSEFDRFSTV